MATEVLLPKLGFAMKEGAVAQWLVPDGGSVTEGTPLFALESEKAVQEIDLQQVADFEFSSLSANSATSARFWRS
jgi:pyruvate/2-oxoglutarate dehydrogenase complex dihydrolipoamide acyltransferase (E2) component